jgi:integrase
MYIIPNLGNVPLRDLRVEHVQAFYSRLIKQNVGITTIRKVHHVLRHAVNLAVESGVLIRNPVSFAHPPEKICQGNEDPR